MSPTFMIFRIFDELLSKVLKREGFRLLTWILRTKPGIYKVWVSGGLQVALQGSKLEFSEDGKSWKPLDAKVSGVRVEIKRGAAKFASPVTR